MKLLNMIENAELEGVGNAFEDLTIEEMAALQGSGEIQPQTAVSCLLLSFVSGAVVSKAYC